MDGQTDGCTKWGVELRSPPLQMARKKAQNTILIRKMGLNIQDEGWQ